jgi:methyl-accepting chemotaxis protein
MNRGGRQGAMMDLERRAYQIKQVLHVSASLRADMPPEAIGAIVAQTIQTTLGFRAAVVNLVVPGARHFAIAATAGLTEAERQRLINEPPPVDHILSLMRPDFQVSRSYFISHEHKYLLEGAGGITLLMPNNPMAQRAPNAWNPDDVFFVPLYSLREQRLIGMISLDLPEDGRIPSVETVEVIEMLAMQAATALDTARLFQERHQERQALEIGLAELLAHLDRMRQRDFSGRAQLRATALNPVAGALNDVSETLGNVLADVRDAGAVVQQQASEMRNMATRLVQSAQQQAEQIRSASDAIQQTSQEMRQIVRQAADSSAIIADAEMLSIEGRQAAERAGEGMSAVREITLQTANRIKRLGESSQEIGNIVQLVSEFAGQTHLLALNAAIEAANAGEHGSGFAIVAREIRTLAQNSNEATKQISARIKGIQNETNQVAVTIEHATQQADLLSELVTQTSTALHAIDSIVQRVSSLITIVHQTADEQARTSTSVSDTMNAIAVITGNTWDGAEYMRASTDRLAELASILRSKIELFRLKEHLQTAYPPDAPLAQPSAPAMPSTASYPAASLPGQSQPPAASYPSRSQPPAPNAENRIGDMAFLATMPMPTVQPAAPGPAPEDGAGFTAKSASAAGTPQPLFPTSSSPFIPIRLSALEENTANTNAAPTDAESDLATPNGIAREDNGSSAALDEPRDEMPEDSTFYGDGDVEARAPTDAPTPQTPQTPQADVLEDSGDFDGADVALNEPTAADTYAADVVGADSPFYQRADAEPAVDTLEGKTENAGDVEQADADMVTDADDTTKIERLR